MGRRCGEVISGKKKVEGGRGGHNEKMGSGKRNGRLSASVRKTG
jgi:hypothetical protein